MTDLSIVCPCYNEGASLNDLLDGYRLALAGFDGVELVLVDNGSTDDTAERLERAKAGDYPFRLVVVTVPVNKGYGHGIMSGLAAAGGEYLAWSHADLQCPPADVARLYEAVMARPDPARCFGKGYRVSDRGRAALLTHLQTLLADFILGHHLEEINAQPKLFHRGFLDEFKAPPIGYELDIYAYYKALRSGHEIVTVDVQFLDRQAGESKWAYSLYSRLAFMARNFLYLIKLRSKADRI